MCPRVHRLDLQPVLRPEISPRVQQMDLKPVSPGHCPRGGLTFRYCFCDYDTGRTLWPAIMSIVYEKDFLTWNYCIVHCDVRSP